eukprot:3009224-Amphidinium_carterae.1
MGAIIVVSRVLLIIASSRLNFRAIFVSIDVQFPPSFQISSVAMPLPSNDSGKSVPKKLTTRVASNSEGKH